MEQELSLGHIKIQISSRYLRKDAEQSGHASLKFKGKV